ncbi:hypothetical protein Leryth_020498 [Lithospermum erythrorhizon]|nr:hypothetical protein Leryth_020498 [Lithospermum erythrorhizon]
MAEGYLKQKKGRTLKKLEQIGGEYFEELRSRSFFQQSSTKIGSFVVLHDLMNDLAPYVAGEFFFRWEKVENFPQDKISRRVRHVSFSGHEFDAFQRFTALGKASEYYHSLSIWISPIDSIGNLKSLRYLNLSGTRINTLPETIGSLCKLQTLDLSRSSVRVLPKRISELTELRYLDNSDISLTDDSKEMTSGMGKLSKLHVLPQDLISKRDDGLKLKELVEMPHLQGILSIWKLRNVKNVEDAIGAKLKLKTSLDAPELRWYSGDNRNVDEELEFNVLSALQPHKKLSSFGIAGKSTSLPSLGQLPLLKDLCVQGMLELETLDCEFFGDGFPVNPAFPSLETLIFKNMPKWKNWCGGFRNMFPKLRLWSPNLKNMPLILFQLLEEIEFRNMPTWVEWSAFADVTG